MRRYRATIRRESRAVVEFDEDEIEEGDDPTTAALELLCESDWDDEDEEVELLEVQEDGNVHWEPSN